MRIFRGYGYYYPATLKEFFDESAKASKDSNPYANFLNGKELKIERQEENKTVNVQNIEEINYWNCTLRAKTRIQTSARVMGRFRLTR